MPQNKLCCDADSLCSMGLKWGMCGQVKNYFLLWCNRKYAWWWSGWEIYSTCALSVSRGLSTLGKAISGIPRGSSGFGLEGAAWLPLKLWTTHIPCAMQEKNHSEVSVFSPQEKPGGGMNYHTGHNWKNLTWVWVQGIICVSLGLQCGHWHGWAWWIASVMNLFTFHTDHSRDPLYALSSQNHRLPKWCPLLAKYSLQTLTLSFPNSEHSSVDGWTSLTSAWHHLVPFLHASSTTAVVFNPQILNARPDSQHPHGDGDASKSSHAQQWVAWGHGIKKVHRSWHVCWWSDFLLAVPLHCHRPEQEAGCSPGGSCASRICARDLTALLRGGPFHHSEIQLVTPAGCQKVCKVKIQLGTGCHCHQQVLGAQTLPGLMDGAAAS